MRNLRLDLCYDGTRYAGWQRLGGAANTLQGKLEQTLSRILGEEISVSGSGRTDAGVHALGQVANFHCHSQLPAGEILAGLRRYLPEDIGIYSCREVPEGFHARLSAKAKTYRYRIWNSEEPCVFQRRYVAIFPEPLDDAAMARGAAYFLGEHDFSAFCLRKGKKRSSVRAISRFTVERTGHEVTLTVTGDGFLYGMVRILAGTLIEVGAHRRDPDSIPALFGEKRALAGPLAPAAGLCLMEVDY